MASGMRSDHYQMSNWQFVSADCRGTLNLTSYEPYDTMIGHNQEANLRKFDVASV